MNMDEIINFNHLLAKLGIWLILTITSSSAFANELIDNTLQPEGAILVPDTFLRRWDPVTVFFDSAKGQTAGKAEDQPEKYLQVEPQHPGAYTWLDKKTLQFRPAEPWPPLSKYTWRIDGKAVDLNTLMSAPVSSQPTNGERDLDRVDDITLTFASPVDPIALKQMLRA